MLLAVSSHGSENLGAVCKKTSMIDFDVERYMYIEVNIKVEGYEYYISYVLAAYMCSGWLQYRFGLSSVAGG